MKRIPLTRGKFAIVDDEDYEWLMQWKWYASLNRGLWYAARQEQKGVNPKYSCILMHRELLKPPNGFEIDHHNNNSLDNRRFNLRICTHSNNLGNQKPQTGGSSKYKGVSWHKKNQKWRAQIGKKRHSLGYFDNEIDAAKAYDKAAKELFGEFANVNF